jgi:hypothetical protein
MLAKSRCDQFSMVFDPLPDLSCHHPCFSTAIQLDFQEAFFLAAVIRIFTLIDSKSLESES